MQLPVEVTPLPPPPAAVRVFVSHNRKEKAWVRRLVAQWRALGIEVFFDEDSILPGEEVVAAIERGIQGCRHVVLILTRASMDSRWVAAEIAMAQAEDPAARSRKLIPVLVEPIAWEEIRPSLRSRAIVDLTEPASRTLNYHTLLRSLEVLRNDLPDPPELDPVTSAVPVPGGDGESGERPDGERTTTATARREMELVLPGKLSEFTPEQQRGILEAIRALLGTGEDVRIKNVREGSVILTLELSPEDAERLYWAVQAGALDEHGVIEARLQDVVGGAGENAADEPWRPAAPPRPSLLARVSEILDGPDAVEKRIPTAPVLPLSLAQQSLWRRGRSAGGLVAQIRMLGGELDVDVLRRCLDILVARHEALRATFREIKGDEPRQVVAPAGRAVLTIDDLTHLDGLHQHEEGFKRQVEESQRSFDLSGGTLARFRLIRRSTHDSVLLIHLNGMIADEVSARLLCRELAALYAAHTDGEHFLPPLSSGYTEHVLRARATERPRPEEMEWWREYLSGAPRWTPVATDLRPAPGARPRGDRVEFALPLELRERLGAIADAEWTSISTVLLAALAAVLARGSGAADVVVGTEVPGRTPETENLVGLFAHPLAVRCDLSADPSALTLVARIHRALVAVLDHQDVPFERVLETLAVERDPGRPPLQVMLSPSSWMNLDFGSMHGWVEVERSTAEPLYDFEVRFDPINPDHGGWIYYRADLYERPTAERLARHLERVIAAMALRPHGRVSEVPLLDAAERRQVLLAGRGGAETHPPEPVHTLFSAIAAAAPDAPAVAYGADTLTYAALEARANRLARYLRRRGVGPESRVGVCLPPGVDLVVAILATLKAGGAYVPLDPAYPADRLAYMLHDAGAGVVLTHAALRDLVPSHGADVLFLDHPGDAAAIADEDDRALPVEVSLESLAYVMYTSGSTGRPKGVMIPHGAVVRLARNPDFIARPDHVARIAQLSPLGFDALTFELWAALLNGGTAVGIDRETRLSAPALARALREERITAAFLVTSLFNQVARETPDAFASLRLLVFGGEVADPLPLRQVLEFGPPRRLVNAYGPTECTTFATWHPVESAAPDTLAVPIGRPLAGTTAYVLDEQMYPVAQGVPGELYLGGTGLGRGYLGRPALTAERFVPDPFGEPGERLYRTGDLVRWNAEMALEFMGRVDAQVKVRGFRIEPGEVEAVLRVHPGVRDAVVIAREDSPGDRRLVAYVVATPGGPVDAAEVRQFLRGRLPDYMVPAAFVRLDALPLTPNGKVDRRALPAPEWRPDETYVGPRTATEEVIAALWSELLGIERVSVHDDLFELGGHSLIVMRLASRIRQVMGVELSVIDIFQSPTPAGVAAKVDAARMSPGEKPERGRYDQAAAARSRRRPKPE
ncbi:MAG TPA: amino acid adenylation domain-containing protein [Longimicrobium sp.]|nr:amino acid adenylation domain-containing protein [Longimicrobium sp.]